MFLNSDYFTPAELTGYARAALANQPINQFSLARWLPRRPIDDLVYRFTKGGDTLIDAAMFRSYDAESTIGARPGISRVSGELPPISRKIPLGEYDRLRQRANPDSAIRTAIMDDAERMVRQVEARIELARGDALVNGSVTINENGVVASASFGRSGGHAVTAATLWSTVASADVIGDLMTWQQVYVDSNGVKPGCFLTSTRVRGLMLRNAGIRGLVANIAGSPTLVSDAMLNQVLANYDLPPLITYDARVRVNGSATRVIADNIGLFLPAPVEPNDFGSTDLGATFYGTTAESLDPRYGLEGDEPGVVAGSYATEDPIAVWTKAAAISLPVLANPDLTFKAIVAS